jgi:hypothetical protein
LLHLLFAATLTAAATGPASLSCTVPGKKDGLTLRGLIPATQPALELTIKEGAGSLTLDAERGDQAHAVEAFDDRVFTLVVTRKEGGELSLYALPRSIKARRDAYAMHSSFDAVLVRAPRPGQSGTITNVRLRCLYDYEV